MLWGRWRGGGGAWRRRRRSLEEEEEEKEEENHSTMNAGIVCFLPPDIYIVGLLMRDRQSFIETSFWPGKVCE